MPSGDVRLHELAENVKDRIETQVVYLVGKVRIVDAEDEASASELRRGLGSDKYGVRIEYAQPCMEFEPKLGSVINVSFHMDVTVLFRKMGGSQARLVQSNSRDITQVVKDVIFALQGADVDILNLGGLSCGAAALLSEGNALQAITFPVTGRSKESRS